MLEGDFFGDFLSKNLSPYKTLEPSRYYFLLSLTTTWMLIFCIINIRFSSKNSNILTARLGHCAIVSILCTLLYFVVWPGSLHLLRHPISYSEWPADFSSFLYREDGLFETLTAILLFGAAILFFRAGKSAIRSLLGHRITLILFLLSVFAMVFMMEEISWGQRIFSWENPEVVKILNYQQETNFHNFFNPIIGDGERIISIFISLALLTAILYKTRITSPTLAGLFPSDKYYFVSVLFFIAGMLSSELFEEVLAIFMFFYGMDMKNFYSKVPIPTQGS